MENNTVSTVDVEMENLRDELPWRDIFPELPTVEAARHQKDPVFWVKADDYEYTHNLIKRPYCSFFLAGYSIYALQPVIERPGGGSISLLTIGQFIRGHGSRFYGLTVCPGDGEMHWREISDECVAYEGPGYLQFHLDGSWEPRRYSEVLKDYPDCKLPPSVDAFKETKFKGLARGEFKRILVEGYRTKVVMTDLGTVRERYRSGEIREIVCVHPRELFLDAVAVAAWSPSVGEGDRLVMAEPSVSIATSRGLEPSITAADHVLKMARHRILVLLHDRERRETLPSEWKRFCQRLEEGDDLIPLEAIFEPPVCYIHAVESEA